MPVSSPSVARDAILTLFKTAMDANAPDVTVLYDDVRSQVPTADDGEWVRIVIEHQDRRQPAIGQANGLRRYRSSGLITVQVFTPFGDGLTRTDAIADIVYDIFDGVSTQSGDGITFNNVTMREIGETGPWFQTNILADFKYDTVK
jgi:hypothetical protein